MGNICCQEPPSQPRQRKQIVPTYSKDNSYKPTFKTAQEQQLEQQRMLLHDFSYAVRNLKNNQLNRPKPIYKGVYVHNLISSDQIWEYFNATLVNQNDQLEPSVVKKILKERLIAMYIKKSLAIEYLVTSQHQSNFIVRNIFYYEDSTYLSLYFDLSKYLHLNLFMNHPQCNQYFRSNLENNIRFIIAGVLLALQELHTLQIVYRGVNFQNIVIREDGYPLLTNLCNLHPQGNSVNIAYSTPFTSPQQLRNQIVGRSADFWSLGVLIFYMITGRYPNPFSNQQRQFNVLGVSPQLCDLINKLLIVDPQQRLGAYNINDLKAHAFFYAFDWEKYWNLDLISPFSREQNKVYCSVDEEHHQYHEQSRFDYSGSTGLMAGMLFMEVGTILLLSNLYQEQYLHEQHEINNNQNMHSGNLASNYFDHGCEIELSDDGHVEDVGGGDYD